MFFQWITATMVYYGLLFASTSLSGDPYLNFVLAVFAELPSPIIYYFVPDLLGRKVVLITSQLLSGICCIAGGILITMPSFSTLQIILVMSGRLCAALCFGLVYLYTAELYPTTLRSTALGFCSTFGRLGGIAALLMGGLNRPSVSMVTFGAMGIVAGLLAFRFPETRNDKLPDTIQEAMNLGRNVKRNKFGFITVNVDDTKLMVSKI